MSASLQGREGEGFCVLHLCCDVLHPKGKTFVKNRYFTEVLELTLVSFFVKFISTIICSNVCFEF